MPYLDLLKNRIDITKIPFSDRDSRLLIFQTPGQSRLYVKLADRLTGIEPGIESYLARPPFNSTTGAIPGSAALAFGWTAAVFIDLAIQASRQRRPRKAELQGGEPGFVEVREP